MTREELNRVMLSQYGLKSSSDQTEYSVHLPSEIQSIGLRPTGYSNPNSVPPNLLVAEGSDHDYQLIVADHEHQLHTLNANSLTSLIKDVVEREHLICQSRCCCFHGTDSLDSNGSATINLPITHHSNSAKYSYQLTPIGAAMPDFHLSQPLAYSTKTQSWSIQVAGGLPNSQFSWRVEQVDT
jgi:hypothetical protein